MAGRLLVEGANGESRELTHVAGFERHPSRDEVCVEFTDGRIEYVETAWVEPEGCVRSA